MIYWLEKLKWRIRKSLGFRKKRIRNIDDILMFDQKLLIKLIILFFMLIIVREVGEGLTRIWWWFFPRVIRAPMEYL